MNIIWNMPTQDKMGEIHKRMAGWHWRRIKEQITNLDISPEAKKALYQNTVDKVLESKSV